MLSRIAVALTVISTFGVAILSADDVWARGGIGHGPPGRPPIFAHPRQFGPNRVVRINRNIDHKHVSVTRRRPLEVASPLRSGHRLTRSNLPRGNIGYLRPHNPPVNEAARTPVNPPSHNTTAIPPGGVAGRLPGSVPPYHTGTAAIYVPPSRADGNTGLPSPLPGGVKPGGNPPINVGLPPGNRNAPPKTGGDGPPFSPPPPPPPSRTGGDSPPSTPYPPQRGGNPFPPRGPIFPGGGTASPGPVAFPPAGSGPAPQQTAAAPTGAATSNPSNPSGGSPSTAGGLRASFAPPPDGEQRFVPNEVLTVSGSNVTLNVLDDIGRRYRLTRLDTRTIRLTGHVLSRWRINNGQPVAAVIRSLAAENLLAAAQPNYLYSLQYQPTPDRPAVGSGNADQYVVSKLRLDETHRLATGNNVVVAVIDSAIDATHPDLSGVIAGRFDALSEPVVPDAHGTAMAGALAAYGNLVGIAPRVRLLAVRALSASTSGSGGLGTGHAVITGLDWAATKGARVINMSFAGPADPEMAAVLARASQLGIVLVAAAGNAGPKSAPLYPAAYQQVIAVTATDSDDHLLEEANRGAYIAVSAPGVNVLVAEPGGGYRIDSGTSIAAAHVSGIAALLIERNPRLSPQALRNVLTATARPLGPKSPETEQAFGAGLVDPLDAITTLDTASPPQSSIAVGPTP